MTNVPKHAKPAATALALALCAFTIACTTMTEPRPPATAANAPTTPSAAGATRTPAADADPLLWLEDVTGERALGWVRARNAESEQRLKADAGFEQRRQAVLEVLDSKARIPAVSRIGGHVYNFWRDAANPRGLWRRTTLDDYAKPVPAWETVLDLDALGKAEGENWVWKGAQCLPPAYRRCLVHLSRGGADAAVSREFDLVDRRFVAGGFALPEGKNTVAWIDADSLLVGTDFGPPSRTASGYPRVIKRWTRGTPLAQATTVFEGQESDVGTWAMTDHTAGSPRLLVQRSISSFNSETHLLTPQGPRRLPKPDDASVSLWGERVLLRPRSDWSAPSPTGTRVWPKGSLLWADAAAFIDGRAVWQPVFTPTATRSLQSFSTTRTRVLLDVLDTVAGRIEQFDPVSGTTQAVALPPFSSASLVALNDRALVDDPLAEDYLLTTGSFLEPNRLERRHTGSSAVTVLKSMPAFFDATGMRVEQRFARSKDGTRVPYFVVWPRNPRTDGRNPTLLYGYGGFEVSLTPNYLSTVGRTWLAQGGVYALANIRGGGEFGPAWHQAAQKADKQRSYDDFAAVAEDLIATGVTRPAHLGIQGGSNGGLLVGAVMLQRPELFGAVVSQVPLLDMQRYHKLLAGASWMGEYGNPDNDADWAFISRYSPYQAVQRLPAGTRLPAVLFTTSTRDDRVHPGHARKMAERMRRLGHTPLYWENIEGGHGGAADNAQAATMRALADTFLWQQLAPR